MNIGTNGYAWSSSSYAADGSNAYNAGMLNFNSTNVNPLNNGNRAIARAVRCVQHLRAAFIQVKGERFLQQLFTFHLSL